jgi:hypothetical protein
VAVESFEVDCMALRAEAFSWGVEAAVYWARAAWIESERGKKVFRLGARKGDVLDRMLSLNLTSWILSRENGSDS